METEAANSKRATARAVELGTTLRAVVEEALQRSLGLGASVRTPLRLQTWPAQPTPRLDEAQVLAAIRAVRDGVGRTWTGIDPAPADPRKPSRGKRPGANRPTRRGGSK